MPNRKPLDRRFTSNGDLLKAAEDDIAMTFRDHLTPEGIATIIAFLQPAAFYKPANADAIAALQQVEWFADTLTEMLGADEPNRLMEKLGL
jgi:hypothetical protein